MADLLGTDEFLVNRNDVTYTQQQDTLMASLETTDYLLINRAGQTYKITGGDLIDSVIDPLSLTVTLTPSTAYTKDEVTAIPIVSGGKQPDGGYVFSYQWVTADDAAGTNKTNITGETGATYTPAAAFVGKYLGCVVSTTDALSTSAEGEAYIGPISVFAEAPVIDNVVISQISDSTNRFTDKEFPYVTTMAVDGEPAPTYEVKAKLSGTTFDFDVKSDVITDVEGGGVDTCETDSIQSVEAGFGGKQHDAAHPGVFTDNNTNLYNINNATFECWFNIPVGHSTYSTIMGYVSLLGNFSSGHAEIAFTGTSIDFKNKTGGSNLIHPFTPDGKYHHLAVVLSNGTDLKMFLDGELVKTGTSTYPWSDQTNRLTIGYRNKTGEPNDATHIFNGALYNVRFSSSARYTSNFTPQWEVFETDATAEYILFWAATAAANSNKTGTRGFTEAGSLQENASLGFELTFPTTEGFDCFEPGDVVQAESSAVTALNIKLPDSFPTTQNLYIGAVKIDGKMLVSSDKFTNASTQIDCGIASSNATRQAEAWADGVEGAINSNNDSHWRPLGSSRLATITWTIPVDVFASIEVLCSHGDGSGITHIGELSTQDGIVFASMPMVSGTFEYQSGDFGESIVKIIDIKPDAVPPTITVDGGDWLEPADYAGQNRDKVWSSYIGVPNVIQELGEYSWELTFNGVQERYGVVPSNLAEDLPSQVNWNGIIETSGKPVQIIYSTGTGVLQDMYIQVNSTQYFVGTDLEVDADQQTLDLGIMTEDISSLKIYRTHNQNAPISISRIIVDSQELVDFGVDGDHKLVKETPYNTKLTVASSENLELLTGDVFMTDGSSTPATQTKYKLVTTDIESIDDQYASVDWVARIETDTTFNSAFPPSKAVDGNEDSYADSNSGGSYIQVNMTGVFDEAGTHTLEVKSGGASNGVQFVTDTETKTLPFAGGGAQVYTATVTGIPQYIRCLSPNAVSIYYFKIDGEIITDGVTGNKLTLTFPGAVSTNPDLRYFKPGDVVQKEAAGDWLLDGWKSMSSGTPYQDDEFYGWCNAFDGLSDPEYANPDGLTTGTVFGNPGTMIFLPTGGITVTNNVKFYCYNQSNKSTYGLRINGSYWPDATGNYGVEITIDAATLGGRLNTVELLTVGITGPYLSGIRVDDKWLVDPTCTSESAITEVKVISTGYPDSNTMVVDGGEWGLYGELSTNNNGNFDAAKPPANMFDGSNSTLSNPSGFNVQASVTFDAIPVTKVEAFIPSNKYTQDCVYKARFDDGTDADFSPDATDAYRWETLYDGVQKDLVGFTLVGASTHTNSGTSPGCGVYMWRINGTTILTEGATHVEYQTNGGEGTIVSVNTDDNTLLISNTGDRDNRWIIGAIDTAGDAGNSGETGDASNAKNHYVAPDSAVPITQDHAWCNLQIVNDKAQVTGIQKEETQFISVTAKDYSIKFPSVFGTGNAPDVDLPDGTAINVEVKAENEHGSSEKESNTLTASVTRAAENSQLDSNDSADVAKQQAIADAFDAFSVNVNNRRTAIASSLYRLYAGENVSADEFELLEDVVSNAVNVVEPFALDGYYPLYYTAAKADAASSEGTHHTHTINGITYYMPDGGTIYHGNYVSY